MPDGEVACDGAEVAVESAGPLEAGDGDAGGEDDGAREDDAEEGACGEADGEAHGDPRLRVDPGHVVADGEG